MSQVLEYVSNHPFLAGAAVVLAIVVVANEIRMRGGAGKVIDCAAAVTLINNGGSVIDLRSAERFQSGHLIGARNIPIDQLETSDGKISSLRGKPVLVYCDTGINCNKAISMLQSKGIENVVGMRGGLQAWKQENLPLVKN